MSRYNPHFPLANSVFDAAQRFAERCLLGQESLLLDNELLWTTDHFDALRKSFIDQPDTGSRNFYEKLADQLATCQPLDVALMAEIFWIVELGPNNMNAGTKVAKMQMIWDMKPAAPFPEDSPFLHEDMLCGLGSAGIGFSVFLPSEITFAIEAFAAFIAKPLAERKELLSDSAKFAEWLDEIPEGKGRQFYHVLCHLLFPDKFERIFSQGDKTKVARLHGVWNSTTKQSRTALDAALLTVRERLETKYPGQVDYYIPPVGTLIKSAATGEDEVAAARKAKGDTASAGQNGTSAGDIEDPSEIVSPTLRIADNLILFGPPGTGKTYAMQQRMKTAFNNGEDFIFLSFHPSYAYEDFMGGLRPIPSQGGSALSVSFQKGPFMLLCEKAHSRPTERFTLFIDEINRANLAKVFGELITLVEPSKRTIAGSKPTDESIWVTLPYTQEPFSVPDNLDIVATMNTADRSISMLDIALRRRFRFQECPPDPSLIDPPFVSSVDLSRLLQTINDRIEYLLDRDHLIGHALFMGITTLTQLQDVLAERVIPLLQEYFFEESERVSLVLTGNSKDAVFFKTRRLSADKLFPRGKNDVGFETRTSSIVADPRSWNEADIIGIYGGSPESAVSELTEEESALPPSHDPPAEE